LSHCKGFLERKKKIKEMDEKRERVKLLESKIKIEHPLICDVFLLFLPLVSVSSVNLIFPMSRIAARKLKIDSAIS